MERRINDIKTVFQAAGIAKLPELVKEYEGDGRSGVQALVKNARRRLDAWEEELARTEKMKEYEKKYGTYAAICGIDEVGRGPLAGPVVAGAVILPKDCDILYINDSKQLSEKKREELYEIIMEKAVAVGLGYAGPERIDEINILQATFEAMRQAIGELKVQPDLLLNDAVTIPQVEIRQILDYNLVLPG